MPAFAGARGVRDVGSGVRIDFIVAGEFPGDGKSKPVAFPDPASLRGESATVEQNGIRYLGLVTLIELKLASGMTSPGRLRDLSDVLELIRVLGLDEGFAERLSPYVRGKYVELWRAACEASGGPEV